jgi:putative tryptophan/tyrosine transport system substrate-binding protein
VAEGILMHRDQLNRRKLVALLGGSTAFILSDSTSQAQQPLPVVGLLRVTPAAPFKNLVTALREGLATEGFVDGQNVALEQRWADNQPDLLPGLAADLVRLKASVIVGNVGAIEAVRAVAQTMPFVFVTGDDPVAGGLVTSLGRPQANLTGVTFFGGAQLDVKRLELLHDLVPAATIIAVLGGPNYYGFDPNSPAVMSAARTLGRQITVVEAKTEADIEPAFAKIVQARAGALLVSGSPFFTSNRQKLIALAARFSIPAIYDLREFVLDGGLISYSASITAAYRQAGIYAGRILKGTKTSELPVLQPTTFELAINLKTARALGLTVPLTLQASADEVIE